VAATTRKALLALVETPVIAVPADVRDELVGDLRERDQSDIELLFRDQAGRQIERPSKTSR